MWTLEAMASGYTKRCVPTPTGSSSLVGARKKTGYLAIPWGKIDSFVDYAIAPRQ